VTDLEMVDCDEVDLKVINLEMVNQIVVDIMVVDCKKLTLLMGVLEQVDMKVTIGAVVSVEIVGLGRLFRTWLL